MALFPIERHGELYGRDDGRLSFWAVREFLGSCQFLGSTARVRPRIFPWHHDGEWREVTQGAAPVFWHCARTKRRVL